MDLKGIPAPPGIILTYHEIVRSECAYRYAVTRDRFEEHLNALNRLRPANGQTDPGLITFDDGHASNYRYAFPLLEQYGRKAIFFVSVAEVGQRPEAVTWSQLG